MAHDSCAQGDVLACWEAEDIVGVGEGKDQAVDIWCDFFFAGEGEGSPLAGVEYLCSFTLDVCVRDSDKVCCLDGTVRLVVSEFLLHVKLARCPYTQAQSDRELRNGGNTCSDPEISRCTLARRPLW